MWPWKGDSDVAVTYCTTNYVFYVVVVFMTVSYVVLFIVYLSYFRFLLIQNALIHPLHT